MMVKVRARVRAQARARVRAQARVRARARAKAREWARARAKAKARERARAKAKTISTKVMVMPRDWSSFSDWTLQARGHTQCWFWPYGTPPVSAGNTCSLCCLAHIKTYKEKKKKKV